MSSPRSRKSRVLLLALAALALLALPASAATVTDSSTETYDLPADGSIELVNANGDILVVVWDRPEIEVETLRKATATSDRLARRVLDDLRSEVQRSGDHLKITTRRPEKQSWTSWFRPASGSITYVVSLPASIAVEARSTNGDVTVEGAERKVNARTTNGHVHLRHVAGDVAASSTNGGVQAEIGSPLHGAEISTTNGRIRLAIADGTGVDLEARAVNGRVKVDLPIRLRSQGRRGNSVRGELYGGGAPVSVRSVNGSITVSETR